MKNHFTSGALLLAVFCFFLAGSCNLNRGNGNVHLDMDAKPFEKISDYGFFKDGIDFSKPGKGVIAYRLVNSMFNDFSLRENFIYLPEGQSFNFDSTHLLDLPAGSCLINVVYYWKDERNISLGKKLIETQLLERKQSGWEALDYVWSEDQKDAVLTEGGAERPVTWVDKNGNEKHVNFVVSAKSECKSCHWYANHVSPIGIKVGNLNADVDYSSGKKNQLDHWIESGLLKHFEKANAAKYQNWKDTTQPLEQRVRSYMDANCAHCHNPQGPANVSGLLLNADNYSMETYGVCKLRLSGGKGTCYLKYDIVPGKPSESIIACRMASSEYGVKMQEFGRTVVDNEGLSLITQWIKQMKGNCPSE